ncbi:MAG: hypothetical protein AAB875_00225, partial [Patescibacteria group bacterium]
MKRILIPFFIAAIFAVIFGGSYFLGKFSKVLVKGDVLPPTQSTATPRETDEEKTLSILLLGYGGPGHEGGTLSD